MHFLSFISVISQNETDCHNATFWENSSEEGSWVGWDQPGVSCCFFGRSLLALQKGWWSCNCTCEKIHFGTEVQYCGWRHVDRMALGRFVFFPFCFPAFFRWGVKFSRHSHSRLLTQIPNLCAPCLGAALSQCAYCFSFSSIWALSWCCRMREYCVVCGAAASTAKRAVSAELKRCFLLDAVWGFLKIKIWNTVHRVCILVSVVGEHPALSENNFQFTAL